MTHVARSASSEAADGDGHVPPGCGPPIPVLVGRRRPSAPSAHLRKDGKRKEVDGLEVMGAPGAGLEVMETSGGYGGLGRLWRFDGLPPSNLEVEGKMM